jgi:putative endonuclease
MKLSHNYFVYILERCDQSYYTGVTNNIERRVWEHESGVDTKCYTYKRRPVRLRYWERFQNVAQAIARKNS